MASGAEDTGRAEGAPPGMVPPPADHRAGDLRALVLAPPDHDGMRVLAMLREAEVETEAVPTMADLIRRLGADAGAVVLPQEAVGPEEALALATWMRDQPAWSDLPFLLLARRDAARTLPDQLMANGDVTVLHRPFRAAVLTGLVRTALRRRARQYRARAGASASTHARAHPPAAVQPPTPEADAAGLRQKMKMAAATQLAGGIAHDFSNALTAVMGCLELIQTRTKEPRTRQLAAQGLASVGRGDRMIRQLLNFSRIRQLELAPVPVNDLLTGMRGLLAAVLTDTISLLVAPGPEVPHALANAGELELALLNLALNAREAMPDGGVLRITSTAGTEMIGGAATPVVVIIVSDTGHGMSDEVKARAFEPFFTTKDAGSGSGMGLAQVYGLAHQAGGRVTLRSNPGGGTQVELALPQAVG